MKNRIAKLYLEECGLIVAAKIKETLEIQGLNISEEWEYGRGEVILYSESADVKSETEQEAE